MIRCPTCQSDDRADRRVIETLPPTDAFVDPYLCDDEWHGCGCPSCGSDRDTRGVKYPLAAAAGSDEPEMCDDSFHEPPDVYDPGEPRPDPTRYAEWRKGGAGW